MGFRARRPLRAIPPPIVWAAPRGHMSNVLHADGHGRALQPHVSGPLPCTRRTAYLSCPTICSSSACPGTAERREGALGSR